MAVWDWLLSPVTPASGSPSIAKALMVLQVVSDLAIGLGCLSALAAVVWLTRLRRDLAGRPVVRLLAAAALSSAVAQFMAATTPGAPPSGLESLVRLLATVLDVATAIAIWPIIPRLGGLVSERDAALRVLAASEAEYRAIFEGAAVGEMVADPANDDVMLRVNPAFARMLGYRPEELVGRRAWDLSFSEDLAEDRAEFARLLAGEIDVYVREKPYRRRDGSPVWARVSVTVVRRDKGAPLRTHAVVEDIDARRRAEMALREYEDRLRLAVESARIGVWEMDLQKGVGRLDALAAEIIGRVLPPDVWFDLAGPEVAAWVARIHPDDLAARNQAVQAVRAGAHDVVRMEYRIRRDDGGWTWLSHWRAVVARDPATGAATRALGVIMDTTERAMTEAELRATLAQRDLLLREVYHRVKNNLQIIDGLVMMQARQLKDPVAAEALAGLRSRIYALGLVHHQLMTSANLETFDLAPFLKELVANIMDGGDHQQVDLDLDVEPLQVDLDFAIPLGLLVTELVTNALKHALRDGRGRIKVAFKSSPGRRVTLSVGDDGPGRPDGDGNANGLGSLIVAGLVGQLNGVVTTRNDPGLVTEISLVTPERK